jgi:hypothetical protein
MHVQKNIKLQQVCFFMVLLFVHMQMQSVCIGCSTDIHPATRQYVSHGPFKLYLIITQFHR